MKVTLIIPERKEVDLTQLPIWHSEYLLNTADEHIFEFLNQLSVKILRHPELTKRPAFVSLGFWLRNANLRSIVKEYLPVHPNVCLKPRGIVFHVCPSNVDTMFVYSLALSLIAGNKNILRISSKTDDIHLSYLFQIIQDTLNDSRYSVFNNYIQLISYGHIQEINEWISNRVDVRIVWGGDKTVHTFKSMQTAPFCKDIFFPNRISMSIIDCSQYLDLDEVKQVELAQKFYNDSYVFDQMGCSSPKVLFALDPSGQHVRQFTENFAHKLSQIAENKYQNDISSIASFKLNKLFDDTLHQNVVSVNKETNYAVFAGLTENSNPDTLDYEDCAAGYFYLKPIASPGEMNPFIRKNTQTLTYFGIAKAALLNDSQINLRAGVDRLVPIGEALAFNNMWDGMNLIYDLSKKIYIN